MKTQDQKQMWKCEISCRTRRNREADSEGNVETDRSKKQAEARVSNKTANIICSTEYILNKDFIYLFISNFISLSQTLHILIRKNHIDFMQYLT